MFKVKVLTDSITPDYETVVGSHRTYHKPVRLITIAYQAPRTTLAELNTHRIISKSAASSRAEPNEKMVERIMKNAYIPDNLPDGRMMGESKGMQALANLSDENRIGGQALVRDGSRMMIELARQLTELGWHKQDANRYLEPFNWVKGVISSTEWSNFFALRCGDLSYPPFRFFARAVYLAIKNSVPTLIPWGQWHLPFVGAADVGEAHARAARIVEPVPGGFDGWADCLLARWSAARCARVSYYHFGRKTADYDQDDKTFHKLAGSHPKHASPLEHQAFAWKCDGSVSYPYKQSNFNPVWVQHRKLLSGENIREYAPEPEEVEGWNIPPEVFAGEPGRDW